MNYKNRGGDRRCPKPETLRQARRFDRSKLGYLQAGHSQSKAAQQAWADQQTGQRKARPKPTAVPAASVAVFSCVKCGRVRARFAELAPWTVCHGLPMASLGEYRDGMLSRLRQTAAQVAA